jgi:hypothetical protein
MSDQPPASVAERRFDQIRQEHQARVATIGRAEADYELYRALIRAEEALLGRLPARQASFTAASYRWLTHPPAVSGEARPHWAVTVSRNGEQIVTIESNCLSGRDISSKDEATIEDCARHLLAFIGKEFAPPGAGSALPPDPKLLEIAGLVNAYHNDATRLTAAETLREIADVLGKPMEAGVSLPVNPQEKSDE